MAARRSLSELIEFDNKAKANGFRFLFGIDEAGRGPLAGPVVASAVLIRDTAFTNRIADSKLLSPLQRERAFGEIHERAWVGVGILDEKVIDEINILRATHRAMAVAVRDLVQKLSPELREEVDAARATVVLIDGDRFSEPIPYKVGTVVKGDNYSLSIACASIVAKVTRDRIMDDFDKVYPVYGFKDHKGYPTEAHRAAIKEFGPSPIHRRSFRLF